MAAQCVKRLGRGTLEAAGYLLTAPEQRLVQRGGLIGLGAFADNLCTGIALLSPDGQQYCMERLEVVPSHRRRGAGSLLVRAAAALAAHGRRTLYVPFAAAGQRDPLYRLFASQAELVIERQPGYEARVLRTDIRSDAEAFAQHTRADAPLLAAQPMYRILALSRRIADEFPAAARALAQGAAGFRADLSCCMTAGDEIRAVCLVGEDADGLRLNLLYAAPDCGALAMRALATSLLLMLRTTDAQHVDMSVVSGSAARILGRLCPHHEITKRLYLAYTAEKAV